MHFTNAITVFFSLALVSASPVTQHNARTIVQDISTITTDITKLQNNVQAFNGNQAQGRSLIADEQNLDRQIQATTNDVRDTDDFNNADSTTVTNAVNGVTDRIVAVLNDIGNKANQASRAGITNDLRNDLQNLHRDTDALYAAVEARVNDDGNNGNNNSGDRVTVQADQRRVDGAFERVIDAL